MSARSSPPRSLPQREEDVPSQDEPDSHVRKKTAEVGPSSLIDRLKLIAFLVAIACILSSAYFYFMLFQPHPRPKTLSDHKSVPLVLVVPKRENGMACDLPDLKPFDPIILPFVFHPKPANCQETHPRIFESDLNRTVIQVADPGRYGYSKCCYHHFQKVRGLDHSAKYSENCTLITEERTSINPPIEFIQITCFNGSEMVPVDYFGFTPLKTPMGFASGGQQLLSGLIHKIKQAVTPDKKTRQVNVVILGIDAVSHMNFQRVMPLSHAYLTKNLSAVGMSGYTKVGDNTWPNFLPAFTGLSEGEAEAVCHFTGYDSCPLIWKHFSRQRYLTGYAEDAYIIGNFVILSSQGFKNAPTDYYYNTLTFEMDINVGHSMKWCYGSRLSFEILLDFMKKMAFNMNKVQRYFQLIWETALTHDELNGGMVGDQKLLETLTWFKNGGYLDDTVLIMMSDHGMRNGDIVETLQGKLESRMPFLYFTFPPWFIEEYPSAVNNLRRNAKMLTTPFDLHSTLVDLAVLRRISNEKLAQRQEALSQKKGKDRPRGISLFLKISKERDCDQAAIPEAWCVCRIRKPVNDTNNNSLVKEAAEQAVEFINELLRPFPQCAHLNLNSIHNAQVIERKDFLVQSNSGDVYHSSNSRPAPQPVTYSVSFSTSPSNAIFEATATREINGSWTTLPDIARNNLYGNQSFCVDNTYLKLFCFCK